MSQSIKIDLTDISWPGSLLKCNKMVAQMKRGDHLVAMLKDKHVTENLIMLFKGQIDLAYDVKNSGKCYEISVVRKFVQPDHITQEKDRQD